MSETVFRRVMGDCSHGVIIHGIREDGTVFRPSDWVERLASLASVFGPDRRLHYSPLLQPCQIEGRRCLVVAGELDRHQPEIYRQIVAFAQANQLRIQLVGGQTDEPAERRAA